MLFCNEVSECSRIVRSDCDHSVLPDVQMLDCSTLVELEELFAGLLYDDQVQKEQSDFSYSLELKTKLRL